MAHTWWLSTTKPLSHSSGGQGSEIYITQPKSGAVPLEALGDNLFLASFGLPLPASLLESLQPTCVFIWPLCVRSPSAPSWKNAHVAFRSHPDNVGSSLQLKILNFIITYYLTWEKDPFPK